MGEALLGSRSVTVREELPRLPVTVMVVRTEALLAVTAGSVGTGEHVPDEGVGQPDEHVAGGQALSLESAETDSHSFARCT